MFRGNQGEAPLPAIKEIHLNAAGFIGNKRIIADTKGI